MTGSVTDAVSVTGDKYEKQHRKEGLEEDIEAITGVDEKEWKSILEESKKDSKKIPQGPTGDGCPDGAICTQY